MRLLRIKLTSENEFIISMFTITMSYSVLMSKDYNKKNYKHFNFPFNHCISKRIYKDHRDQFCFFETYNSVLEPLRMVVP